MWLYCQLHLEIVTQHSLVKSDSRSSASLSTVAYTTTETTHRDESADGNCRKNGKSNHTGKIQEQEDWIIQSLLGSEAFARLLGLLRERSRVRCVRVVRFLSSTVALRGRSTTGCSIWLRRLAILVAWLGVLLLLVLLLWVLLLLLAVTVVVVVRLLRIGWLLSPRLLAVKLPSLRLIISLCCHD